MRFPTVLALLVAVPLLQGCPPALIATGVGIAVAVERARPLQALLRANNVAFASTEGDRVLVPPDQTGGLMIEFMPQT